MKKAPTAFMVIDAMNYYAKGFRLKAFLSLLMSYINGL